MIVSWHPAFKSAKIQFIIYHLQSLSNKKSFFYSLFIYFQKLWTSLWKTLDIFAQDSGHNYERDKLCFLMFFPELGSK